MRTNSYNAYARRAAPDVQNLFRRPDWPRRPRSPRRPRRPWRCPPRSSSSQARSAARLRQRRRDAHGVEHMRALDLARRAGGARRNRDTREIERDHGRLGPEARHADVQRVRQARGPRTEHDDIRPHRQQAVEQPVAQGREPSAIALQRSHSLFRRRAMPTMPATFLGAGAPPHLLAAAADQRLGDHKTLAVEDDRADALGPRRSCGPTPPAHRRRAQRCRAGSSRKPRPASQRSAPPVARAIAAAAATGCRTPVSPFAACKATMAAPGSASSASSASSVTTPLASLGAPNALAPQAASTALCSTAGG